MITYPPEYVANMLVDGVLELPVETGRLTSKARDDYDVWVNVDVAVQHFQDIPVDRVGLTVFFDRNFYARTHNPLGALSRIAVGVPNSRDFNDRDQVIGSLGVAFDPTTDKGMISALLPAYPAAGEMLMTDSPERILAVTEFINRLSTVVDFDSIFDN